MISALITNEREHIVAGLLCPQTYFALFVLIFNCTYFGYIIQDIHEIHTLAMAEQVLVSVYIKNISI